MGVLCIASGKIPNREGPTEEAETTKTGALVVSSSALAYSDGLRETVPFLAWQFDQLAAEHLELGGPVIVIKLL